MGKSYDNTSKPKGSIQTKDGEKTKDAPKHKKHANAKSQPARITAHRMLHTLVIVFRHWPTLQNVPPHYHAAGRKANVSAYYQSTSPASLDRGG
jgi:hypothetical protein